MAGIAGITASQHQLSGFIHNFETAVAGLNTVCGLGVLRLGGSVIVHCGGELRSLR